MRLQGKRTLVIGGGGDGIGRGITRAFSDEGATVVVADVVDSRAREAAAEIAPSGHSFAVDVRSPAELARLVEFTIASLGGIDVVVTVVGGQMAFVPAVVLHEMADEDWDTVYELNLRYVSRTLRLVVPQMLAQGTGGSIVSVGSVTGFMAAPNQGSYGVTKAGLLSLAKTVGAEYSHAGIRMNVIAAGAVATAASSNVASDDWVDEIPLGRVASTAEVAAGAVYLASDESAMMTGQQIVLDGGVSVRGPFGS